MRFAIIIFANCCCCCCGCCVFKQVGMLADELTNEGFEIFDSKVSPNNSEFSMAEGCLAVTPDEYFVSTAS